MNIPSAGQKAYFKNVFIGMVIKIEVIDSKWPRDCSHMIHIRTVNGHISKIGKRKNEEFSINTYNFKY